ncbi:GNAT family N-acetyltransferase [Clostridium sp. DL1XJH146]
MKDIKLIKAKGEDLDSVRELFLKYVESLPFKLDFQDFDKEFKTLPGKYAEPYGTIILAMQNKKPVGCIALRKLEDNICEMKRLYVKPEERGNGVGRKLAGEIIEQAKEKKYKIMRLDTLVSMKSAVDLYKQLGFKEIGPYIYNPLEDALYMELEIN